MALKVSRFGEELTVSVVHQRRIHVDDCNECREIYNTYVKQALCLAKKEFVLQVNN